MTFSAEHINAHGSDLNDPTPSITLKAASEFNNTLNVGALTPAPVEVRLATLRELFPDIANDNKALDALAT